MDIGQCVGIHVSERNQWLAREKQHSVSPIFPKRFSNLLSYTFAMSCYRVVVVSSFLQLRFIVRERKTKLEKKLDEGCTTYVKCLRLQLDPVDNGRKQQNNHIQRMSKADSHSRERERERERERRTVD